jgi:hypothetical protein
VSDILEISNTLGFCARTRQMAVMYYDGVMTHAQVSKAGAGLILFMCLYLAAKFEGENMDGILGYKDSLFDSFKNMGYATCTEMDMETFILNALGWNASLITASEILEVLISLISQSHDQWTTLKQKAELVIDLCLTDSKLFHYEASIMAYAGLFTAMDLLGNDSLSLELNQTQESMFMVLVKYLILIGKSDGMQGTYKK